MWICPSNRPSGLSRTAWQAGDQRDVRGRSVSPGTEIRSRKKSTMGMERGRSPIGCYRNRKLSRLSSPKDRIPINFISRISSLCMLVSARFTPFSPAPASA